MNKSTQEADVLSHLHEHNVIAHLNYIQAMQSQIYGDWMSYARGATLCLIADNLHMSKQSVRKVLFRLHGQRKIVFSTYHNEVVYMVKEQGDEWQMRKMHTYQQRRSHQTI